MGVRVQVIEGNDRHFERANASRHSCAVERDSRGSVNEAFRCHVEGIVTNVRLLNLRLYRLYFNYRR